jgi:hypothetical protein
MSNLEIRLPGGPATGTHNRRNFYINYGTELLRRYRWGKTEEEKAKRLGYFLGRVRQAVNDPNDDYDLMNGPALKAAARSVGIIGKPSLEAIRSLS